MSNNLKLMMSYIVVTSGRSPHPRAMPRQHDLALLAAVGGRIRATRTARGITQERLAERVGIEPRTLSAMENGHQGASLAVLAGIADALKTPLGNLVDMERAPPPAPVLEDWCALWDGMTDAERARAYRLVREFIAS